MLAKRRSGTYPEGAKVWRANTATRIKTVFTLALRLRIYLGGAGEARSVLRKKAASLTEGEALFTDSGQMHYQRALEPDTVLRVIVFESSVFPALETFRLLSPKL